MVHRPLAILRLVPRRRRAQPFGRWLCYVELAPYDELDAVVTPGEERVGARGGSPQGWQGVGRGGRARISPLDQHTA